MSYAKALVAVLVAAAGALVTALGTSPEQTLSNLDTGTWLVAVGSVLGSGGIVWLTQNVPGVAGGCVKAVVAFLSAGIASLVVALQDSVVSQAEWLTAFGAAVVATGLVYQVRNR